LLVHHGMLIRRCAWHRLYNGYPMLYGVAAWRRRGLNYTDGMCSRCAATALGQWRKGSTETSRPRRLRAHLRVPAAPTGIALAAVVSILIGLALTVAVRRHGGGDVPASALPRATSGAPRASAPGMR
jgi:hypothetical protein